MARSMDNNMIKDRIGDSNKDQSKKEDRNKGKLSAMIADLCD